MTRVRKNMRSLPLKFADKLLLNGRHMAETPSATSRNSQLSAFHAIASLINAFLRLLAYSSILSNAKISWLYASPNRLSGLHTPPQRLIATLDHPLYINWIRVYQEAS
jgi:hypothetical protein